MIAAKMMIQVMVGLSPDMIIAEACRSWSYTSVDYERDKALPEGQTSTLKRMIDEASAYARERMDPRTDNYVRLEWIWL